MREVIATDQAPAAIGTYSQAVKVNGLVFVSGQLGLNPATGEFVGEDFIAQAHQVFKNLQAIAKAAGAELSDYVKLNVYVTDLGNFASFNEVMSCYFSAPFPARAAVEVSALPKGGLVEVEGVLAA